MQASEEELWWIENLCYIPGRKIKLYICDLTPNTRDTKSWSGKFSTPKVLHRITRLKFSMQTYLWVWRKVSIMFKHFHFQKNSHQFLYALTVGSIILFSYQFYIFNILLIQWTQIPYFSWFLLFIMNSLSILSWPDYFKSPFIFFRWNKRKRTWIFNSKYESFTFIHFVIIVRLE